MLSRKNERWSTLVSSFNSTGATVEVDGRVGDFAVWRPGDNYWFRRLFFVLHGLIKVGLGLFGAADSARPFRRRMFPEIPIMVIGKGRSVLFQ